MKFEYPKKWTVEDVHKLKNDRNYDRVLIRCPVSEEVLTAIELEILRERPNFTLCLDWGADRADLSCILLLPSLCRLVIKIDRGEGSFAPLKELPKLLELQLSVADLQSLDFLSSVNPKLESLSIAKTKSRKLSLSVLDRFSKLRALKVDSQSKGIQVISILPHLEELSLSSVTLKDLSCLGNHESLRSVAIKLGSLEEIDKIANIQNLRHVELWRIRNLRNIQALGQCSNLQYLYLQDLPLVAELPAFKLLFKLRRLYLENLLGLTTLSCIADAKGLTDFAFANASQFKVSDFQFLKALPALRRAAIGFKDAKLNSEMSTFLRNLGCFTEGLGAFEFC